MLRSTRTIPLVLNLGIGILLISSAVFFESAMKSFSHEELVISQQEKKNSRLIDLFRRPSREAGTRMQEKLPDITTI